MTPGLVVLQRCRSDDAAESRRGHGGGGACSRRFNGAAAMTLRKVRNLAAGWSRNIASTVPQR